MPGIIANALPNDQTAFGAETAKYDPVTRSVNPETETVAGQLHSILNENGPLVQQARAGALDTGVSRGLLNSSMTAGAGEKAAIDSALPIANADANTYTAAATQNQGFENNANAFNAGATNTSNLNLANAANTSGLSTQQTEQQKAIAQNAADLQTNQILPATIAGQKEVTAATQAGQGQLQKEASEQKITQLAAAGQQDQALQTLKGQQAQTLADIEGQYKSVVGASSAAQDALKTNSQAMAAILANPDTTVEQKQAGVNTMAQILRSNLAIIGSIMNMDLASLLTFEGAPA